MPGIVFIEGNGMQLESRPSQVIREVAMTVGWTPEARSECTKLYIEAKKMDPRCVDAYVGLGAVAEADPEAAIKEMSE